uniref:Uncharacterized protein n=1 Tax=Arundo donax TaxID=35708 RepID=A0A0A9GSR3_ARUDO
MSVSSCLLLPIFFCHHCPVWKWIQIRKNCMNLSSLEIDSNNEDCMNLFLL